MNQIEDQRKLIPEQERPQHHVPLYAFLIGSVISYTGDMLTLLAVPWFVLQTTGSVAQTGITAFFSTLPLMLSAFFGSTLVDRLGYKHTSVLGDVASGLTIMLVPLLYNTIGLAFWQLLMLTFIGGLLRSPAETARAALVPELAQKAGMPLERANALSDGVSRISRFLGAPLAGILIGLIGTSNLLWFDATSFALSALLVGLAVPSTGPVIRTGKSTEKYFASLWEGVRFLRRDALILSITVTVMITNLLDAALFSVVEPAYMKSLFGSPLPFSLLIASSGGAAFVGTLIFGAIGHRLPRRLTFGICFVIGGALRFWVLLIPIFPLLIAWHIIGGLAIGSINPLISTVEQERIPLEMRARVIGTIGAGVTAGIPLGTFTAGYLATWMGLTGSMVVMGALYLAATLSLLINPAMKGMDLPRNIKDMGMESQLTQ